MFVLFDVDGTLVDAVANQRRVWNTWASRHGLDAAQVYRVALRTTPMETFAEVAADRDPQQCLRVLHELEDEDVRSGVYAAYNGASELLAALPTSTWALATSNYEHRVRGRFARLGLTTPEVIVDAPAVTEQLQRASAGLLVALGRPFNSIDQGGQLWIGRESVSTLDAASFGGVGSLGLHIDAPNVEAIPDYTSLLVLRPDPAGGGASLLGDLPAALALLGQDDRIALAQAVFYEGRVDELRGVGGPRLPFPVLDDAPGGRWIRWAAKILDDHRNAGRTGPLGRFGEALETVTVVVTLGRGQLLVLDQRRIAHGRTALGDQCGLPEGTRRWLVQAKVRDEVTAPARIGGGGDE